jgi:hypothetical protein
MELERVENLASNETPHVEKSVPNQNPLKLVHHFP